MTLLYVGSLGSNAGKNLLCLGLGWHMAADGLKLAFMKPYGGQPLKVDDHYTDALAWMINQELGLGQSPEQTCPVVRTQDLAALSLRHQAGDLLGVIRAAAAELTAGRDLLLMAGGANMASGASCGIGGYTLTRELGARVLLVDRYDNDLYLDNLVAARDQLGGSLLGVVINAVDPEMNDALEARVQPFLAREGIPVLGWLPKDELLEAVEVGVLAEMLGAKLLTGGKFSDRLVMRFFIGAMQVGHAHRFFSGVRDFGCIVGGDRPDLQLAAIEGGAACLILTGNLYPGEIILSRAEEHEVPVMVARDDTYVVAQHLERIVPSVPIRHPLKIARGRELVERGVDFRALYAGLGLKTP